MTRARRLPAFFLLALIWTATVSASVFQRVPSEQQFVMRDGRWQCAASQSTKVFTLI